MEHVKAFLGGSGADAFNEPPVIDRLLQLVPASQTADGRAIEVAYLGTATYDLPAPQAQQTGELARRGCHVRAISVSDPAITSLRSDDADYLRNEADVVLVSGGNTLYAVQRWEQLGLDGLLREVAATRGGGARRCQPILAGGSAGAICWFTAGHSRSADPTTFRPAMLQKAAEEQQHQQQSVVTTAAAAGNEAHKEGTWSYIRVHGLDILPGLLCPHYDIAQGDRAVRREEDFAAMLQRHPTERGIALDHWAVLLLPGDGSYEVFPVPGHTRQSGEASAVAGGPQRGNEAETTSADATPGLFVLDIAHDGSARRHRVAATGRVSDLLRAPSGPVTADPLEAACAAANPAH